MTRAALIALVLLLRPAADESPVRLLPTLDGGRCSMVVLSRHRALTAAHCTPVAYARRVIGPDLAELTGDFLPPYARRGATLEGPVLLEGWGCDPERAWFYSRPVRQVRQGILLMVNADWPGLELAVFGRVCHGDSGGAVWAEGGNLLGVITATAVDRPYLSFATPIP